MRKGKRSNCDFTAEKERERGRKSERRRTSVLERRDGKAMDKKGEIKGGRVEREKKVQVSCYTRPSNYTSGLFHSFKTKQN